MRVIVIIMKQIRSGFFCGDEATLCIQGQDSGSGQDQGSMCGQVHGTLFAGHTNQRILCFHRILERIKICS